MGFMDKAKEAAEQARQGMTQAVDQARTATTGQPAAQPPVADDVADPAAPATPAAATPGAPAPPVTVKAGMDDFVSEMKKAARRGKDSLATLVEKIDPGVLADLIIKATAAQEKANIALRDKNSPYRIAEINITATIPPQIGFAVARMGDMDELDDPSSLELLEEGVVDADTPTVSLDGDNPIEDIGSSS